MKRSEKKERDNRICERFSQMSGKDQQEVIDILCDEFDLCPAYLKNILKEGGAISVRKKARSPKKDHRNADIVDMYMSGKDLLEIAEAHGLSKTRVGQIVRSHLGRNTKTNMLEKELVDVRTDIESGMSHKDLLDKYGQSTMRKLKDNLGFNAFDAYVDRRNSDILSEYKNGKSAAAIANEFGLTRDHVYGILHNAGIRSKPTRAEYRMRNEEIVTKFKKGKKSQDLAAEYDMTVTNINIILKNNGGR
jgi:uncharacterized protein (DUF433 family)